MIVLAFQGFGGVGEHAVCWITAPSWLEWATFWYPLSVIVVVGMLCMFVVLIQIVTIARKTKSSICTSLSDLCCVVLLIAVLAAHSWLSVIFQHARVLVFIFQIAFCFAALIAYACVVLH